MNTGEWLGGRKVTMVSRGFVPLLHVVVAESNIGTREVCEMLAQIIKNGSAGSNSGLLRVPERLARCVEIYDFWHIVRYFRRKL